MGDLYEKINELSEQLANCQDALQQAIAAGNGFKQHGEEWKANAHEAATRLEAADRRVYELERNRELFQKQRDDAIKERDLARRVADAAMTKCSIALVIERVEPKPGDLFILRLDQEADRSELEVFSTLLRYLTRRYPQNTFISFAKGVVAKLEQISETDLRAMGLISARRVDAGVQQLEAAFGTQQAAIKQCREFLVDLTKEHGFPDLKRADELEAMLEKILTVALVAEEKPTREQLIDLIRECRSLLVWNTNGDNSINRSGKDLERRITEATGDPADDAHWLDREPTDDEGTVGP